MQAKRPKKKHSNLELPSITLFEPLRSQKPTRHHVPLEEIETVMNLDEPIHSTPKPPHRSPCKPIDKVTTAMGFKASHLSHRVVIRPLFEDRKELEAEIAQKLLEQRDLEDDEGDDNIDEQTMIQTSHVMSESQDIFQSRVLQPLGGNTIITQPASPTLAQPPSPTLRSNNSTSAFHNNPEKPTTPLLKAQKSNSSFSEASDGKPTYRRQRSVREVTKTIEKSFEESQHHLVFMMPEQVLKTNKRHSLLSAPSVAALRRPFQKLLHTESRMVYVKETSIVLECIISISLLSTGDCLIQVMEKSKPDKRPTIETTQILTLTEPEAIRLYAADDIEVFSPHWAQRACSQVALDSDLKIILSTSPHSHVVVLTMQQDVPCSAEPIQVQTIGVVDGLSIAARVPQTPTTLYAHLREAEIGRIILRMDNMNVSVDHVRQLSLQKAWCAMFLHDMPLVELLLQSYFRRRPSSPTHDHIIATQPSEATPPAPQGESTSPSLLRRGSSEIRASSTNRSTPIETAVEETFASEELNNVRLVAKSMASIVLGNTLMWLQKQEAAVLYSRLYVHSTTPRHQATDAIISHYQAKEYERRAILLLIDEMVLQFLHYECRVELHVAKADGGYNDYIATRIQSAFRMCVERRRYTLHQRVRNSAAKLIQTLQRGISARKRYIEKKLERERYLYFGFRSSVVAQTKLDNPVARLQRRTALLEARRLAFLMGVVTGANLYNKPMITPTTTLPTMDVISLLNTHAMEVGCPSNLGSMFQAALFPRTPSGLIASSSEVVSVQNVQTILMAILRTLDDDTFGRPSSSARSKVIDKPQDSQAPPRWLLKSNPALHASNLARLVDEKIKRLHHGKQSAYFVACHYRSTQTAMNFERCRTQWHHEMSERYNELCMLAQFSVDDLVSWGMEKLQEAVKVWGWDSEPMFETFNVCLTHRFGKQAIQLLEAKFNEFAAAMNNRVKRVEIHTLREEIQEELQGFEKLLALRCLNFGYDDHFTPASDLLHLLLKAKSIDTDNMRIALPSILPVATYLEKVEMAKLLLAGYASDLYGHAFVLLLWSCLDAAENATLEAGQLLEKLAKKEGDISPLAKALELLTGSHLLRLLEFCMKVSPLNERVRDQVRQHMEPYIREGDDKIKLETHRICATLSHMTDANARKQLLASRFDQDAFRQGTDFWATYERLFGEMDQGYAQVSMETPETS